jgi:hypothetical protein
MNNSVLKSRLLSTCHLRKPARAYFVCFEKLSATKTAFCVEQLRTYYFHTKLKAVKKT